METQNAKLLFSQINFGQRERERLEIYWRFQKGVTLFVNKHSSTTHDICAS